VRTTAAVLVNPSSPLEIAEVEVPELENGQLLVEVAFSGVCHTQLLETRGRRGEDRFLPHCLGHEGSGRVLEVGPGVTALHSGDDVVLSWIRGPGADVPGAKYLWDGRQVNAGAVTTFSRHAVVSENRATRLSGHLDLLRAAMLGCAVPTGAGAVLHTAGAQAGDSLVVFGCGGVGLMAVAAAALVGCSPVVAVDVVAGKLPAAERMGATHTIDAGANDAGAELSRMFPGGVDIAIEASGRTEVMARALEVVRPRGGRTVVVGNAAHGERLTVDPAHLNLGKALLGTWGGDCVPQRDLPRFASLIASGELRVEELIGAVYPLERVNQALLDLEEGRAVRPILDMSQIAARS
jgi:S-(hydroxymethyl)glutathione dehydrogenase/alcohol dehydrogenase